MLKLTKKQLGDAASLAYRIEGLEASKDKCHGISFPFLIAADYRRDVIDVPVPMESVLKELNVRLKTAHAELAAMGIELVPGGDDE